MMYKKLTFTKHSDKRGDLIPLEFGKDFERSDIPFDVKRCFLILPKTDEVRGEHAHRWVEQVVICLEGSVDLCLKDGKGKAEIIPLNKPTTGIHISKLVWNELRNFSDRCKLLVLASDHYIPEEYINSYEEFLEFVNNV